MRPGTFYSPGLGKEMNGMIASILGEWRQQQRATASQTKKRSESLSANKRKKQRGED